jgi:hypothetical protein
MAKEFFAAATIQFWNEAEDTSQEENIVLTEVENFVDAVTRIEAYYSNSLETIIELNLFEGPFVILNNRALEALCCGDLEKEEE